MKLLPFQYILDKNSMSSDSPWLVLIDVTLRNKYTSREWVSGETIATGDLRKFGVEMYEAIQDHTASALNSPDSVDSADYWLPQSVTYRLVRNPEIVSFKGFDYQPYHFTFENISSNSDGQLPQFNLKLSNINQNLRPILNTYKGGKNSLCKIYIVNYNNITYDNEEISYEFSVDQPTSTTSWLTLTLITSSPLRKRFPQVQYTSSYCPWFFRGCECKYTGTEYTNCGHTFDDCELRNNTENFGGFLGLQGKFMRIV